MDYTALAAYDFNSESDSEDLEIPAKKSRPNIFYERSSTFENTEAALQHVSSAKAWTLRRTTFTEDRKKSYYDCKGHKKCPIKMYLLKLQTDAYQWAKSDAQVITRERSGMRQYYNRPYGQPQFRNADYKIRPATSQSFLGKI